MHRLERLARRGAEKTRHTVPELFTATDCLRTHMLPSDWEMLQSFNDKFGLPDLLEHFVVLRNWLIDSWFLRDWGKTNSVMTTSELRKEANNLAERVRELSREIAMQFPELSEPYSIHTVVRPTDWTKDLDWGDPSNCELKVMDSPRYPIAFDPRLATDDSTFEEECEDTKLEKKGDLIFGLCQRAAEMEANLRGLSRYCLTSPVAGNNSLLDNLHSFLTQYGKTMRAPPARRKHPIWCRYASFRLANSIDKSDFFEPASKTQKYRIIEYSILAVADYHSLEKPEGWGQKEIQRSLE